MIGVIIACVIVLLIASYDEARDSQPVDFRWIRAALIGFNVGLFVLALFEL